MKKYAGIHVPLITPFIDGKINWSGLERLVEHYCESDVVSLIPCGTTGENCTLTHEEQRQIIGFVTEKVNRRKLVIAGTGSNNVAEALDLTRYAHQAGVDACLVVSPYYNRPTQKGIIDYYKALVDSVPVDVILYNIPSRTGSDIGLDAIYHLAELPRIVGIKEGLGDMARFQALTSVFRDNPFSVLTGEDTLLFESACLGADGGIMASAGVIPQELARLFGLIQAQHLVEARELHHRLLPLIRSLFVETNPIATKYAICKKLGLPYEVRAPLTAATERGRQLVDACMEGLFHSKR